MTSRKLKSFRAWFASSRNGTVGVWNVRTGALVGAVPGGTADLAVGFTKDNTHLVIAGLGSLEPLCSVAPVDGAFYCFVRVNAAADPMRLAERLVREHGVAVIPGTAFGALDGCSFRVAFGALQKETVAEGIGRLVRGLRTVLD